MSLQTDDGGGPGKRTPFEPKPLSTNFGTPPAHKAAIWAKRKAEHKPPPRVVSLIREIGALAKQLRNRGISREDLQNIVASVAVVNRFEHLECLSVQTLQKVKEAMESYAEKSARAITLRHGQKTYDFWTPERIRNSNLTGGYYSFYFAHFSPRFTYTSFGFEPTELHKISADEVADILAAQGYKHSFYRRKAIVLVSAFKKY